MATCTPSLSEQAPFAYGEYTFAGDMNITPYFEWMYNRRQHNNYDPGTVLFQGSAPPTTRTIRAIRMVWAVSIAASPMILFCSIQHSRHDLRGHTVRPPAQYCAIPRFAWICRGAIGPSPLEAQVSLLNDRDRVSTDITQIRFVGGFTGDLPQLTSGHWKTGDSNWPSYTAMRAENRYDSGVNGGEPAAFAGDQPD